MVIPRLLYGYVSQSSEPFNFKLPWQTSNQDGFVAMNYNLADAVTDNLKHWANTNWGERPMKFQYGLDARRYLFDPVSVAKERILENAKAQLSKFFGFLNIDELSVLTEDDDPDMDPNTVRFVLVARFKSGRDGKIVISEDIGR